MLSSDVTGTLQRAESADEVAAAMRASYGADLVDVDGACISYVQRTVKDSRFAVSETRVHGSMVSEADRLPFLVVVDVVNGTQVVAAGGEQWRREDSTPFLFPLARKRAAWRDVALRHTVLSIEAVDRELRGHGLPPIRVMRLDQAPVDDEHARHWADVTESARRFAASAMFADSPLSRSAVFGMLTAGFVDAFAIRRETPLPEGRTPDAGASAVRRAVAFIADHAAEDIDVTMIADAAGVSTRSLQNAFRSRLGTRPLQMLRLERIRRARAYGEAPGETLARQ